jgi:starvation-inducible DNA-binding protein
MDFVGLHDLFDDIAEHFEDQADEIAERITALGGQALGTARAVVSNTRVPQLPTEAITGAEYIDLLAERIAIHDANLNQEITFANQVGDLDTNDLLNEVSRTVSQDLWFLEAHFQTQPTSSIQIPGGAGGGRGQSQQRGQTGGQQTGGPGQMGHQSPAGQQAPTTHQGLSGSPGQ